MKDWLDPSLTFRLAAALLQFVWQAAAVAAAYAVLDWLFRKGNRGAEARYALACGALAVMALLPMLTFARSGGRIPDSPDAATTVSAGRSAAAAPPGDGAGRVAALPGGNTRDAIAPLRPWIVMVWLGGVLALSLRLLAGIAGVRRLARHRTSPAGGDLARSFSALARRVGVSRTVRLLESASARVPAAIGVFRPVVLIPVSALTGLDARDLDALLAHELAHVRRHDYLVNLFQAAAETLFFYHPAVWWISARIRAERENACDDSAVAATGDRRVYAAALVKLEGLRGARAGLALAADGGSLLRRIARLFPDLPPPAPDARGAGGGLVLAAVLLAAAAARAAVPPGGPPPPPSPARAAAAQTASPTSLPSAAAPAARPAAPAGRLAAPLPLREASPASPASAPAARAPGRAGNALSEDELRSLTRSGVTPEYLGRLAALGYTRASVDELASLRIHGVTTEEIAEFQKLFGEVSLDECVAFRIHGVTPDYVLGFRQAGYADISPDRIVSLRIHGATASDAAEIAAAGARPSLDDIVSARIHGVDAAFARAMRSDGFPDAGVDDLVSFRIHGVSPEFVRSMRSIAFPDLTAEDAVGFRIHGVSPEFVRELKALGVPDLTADGVTELKIHGWTIERIRNANTEAGRRLSIEELVDRGAEWRTP